ncbi:hypothetical protein LAZ67_14001698 [Cordylochernes scorpioides]|uniref:CCHC-type domain-containing protein n=1 Tax=Cordylochernes scorpioides TaxID=51811 RepID=A0ABY6L6A8_9ARAC|nr:hypothetical protein LAZ67_14001698 [Cordylochernes scorpioides]
MCCSNGKVRLPLIDLPPEPLRSLLSGENSDSVNFLRNIRKYNSCFQMPSFGAENQTHSVTFPTTFSIQGQVYHRIGSLMPSENQPSRFLQIYFVGNDDDDIQTDRRCQQIQEYVFKTALENLPSDAYRVVVNADRTPPGQHPRRYNAPTANEVAVVLAGNQFGSRDIVLHQRDNLLKHVSDTHRFYDALQYPLIFWKGQEGYSFHIPQIDPNTRQPLSNSNKNRTDDGIPICFKCNKPGHIARYCRVRFVRIVEEDPIVTQDMVEEEIRIDKGTEKSSFHSSYHFRFHSGEGYKLIEDASKYREYVVILYRVCSACCSNTIYWFNSLKLHLKNLPSDAYRVVVNADRTPPGQHPRRYNAPTANEVAVVLAGQEGYSFHIPQIDPNTRQPLSSKVSSMDFYGYSIMVRRNSPNVIVQFGQLFNQFLVECMPKVENERLRYLTLLQRKLACREYIHLRNAPVN